MTMGATDHTHTHHYTPHRYSILDRWLNPNSADFLILQETRRKGATPFLPTSYRAHPSARPPKPCHQYQESNPFFQQFVEKFSLDDARLTAATRLGPPHTWTSPGGATRRIDYILVPRAFQTITHHHIDDANVLVAATIQLPACRQTAATNATTRQRLRPDALRDPSFR